MALGFCEPDVTLFHLICTVSAAETRAKAITISEGIDPSGDTMMVASVVAPVTVMNSE